MLEKRLEEEGMGPLEIGRRRYQKGDFKGALEGFTEVSISVLISRAFRDPDEDPRTRLGSFAILGVGVIEACRLVSSSGSWAQELEDHLGKSWILVNVN